MYLGVKLVAPVPYHSEKSSKIIVSGANSAYFDLLKGLVESLETVEGLRGRALGILDLGLSDSERAYLDRKSAIIVRPEWPFEEMKGADLPEWFKAMVCRPFLPRYFPGFEFIFWIDADSWLQNAQVLDLFEAGAREDGFAVVPTADRAYGPAIGNSYLMEFQREWYAKGFGEEVAEKLYRFPVVAAGALCGRSTAPHWAQWQLLIAKGLGSAVFREIEQTALNVLVHGTPTRTHLLPAYCHWVCNSRVPAFDEGKQKFVEPFLPYEEIGIMGLADNTKRDAFLIETTTGILKKGYLTFGGHTDGARSANFDIGEGCAVDGVFTRRFMENTFKKLNSLGYINFVQVGAMDGLLFDHLHHAIKEYRWDGILIEPLPDMFQRLKRNYEGCEGLIFENCAIAPDDRPRPMWRVPVEAVESGLVPPWAMGISSLYDDRNAIGGNLVSDADFASIRKHLTTETVACSTFGQILSRHSFDTVDLVAIDAEGSDMAILRQVDFMALGTQVAIVEICNLPADEKRECLTTLYGNGFRCFVSEDRSDILAVRGALADA